MSTIINATTTNGVVIQPDNSGSLVLQTNSGTTALTIDTSQNVGIGTTSPISGRALTLNNASNYYGIRFQVGGTSIAQLIQETTGFFYIDSNMNNESGGTIFRTGGTERMRITSDGLLQFNSGYGSVATAYGCRAWVNFNGTGTVAIRASGNVSSITDNGAGDYTVNFTTALADTNYAVVGTAKYVASAEGQNFRVGTAAYGTTVTTSSVRINITNGGNAALTDSEMVNVSVFR